MDPEALQREIDRLQRQLTQALADKNKEAEIDSLLQIGATAVEDSSRLAHFHFKLAEKVIRKSGALERLHEALGGQGRALRREKDFAAAIERYQAAEQAADESKNTTARVQWMLQRASAHRTRDELDVAIAITHEADALLRPKPKTDEESIFRRLGPIDFGDAQAVGTLAELEGQIGINLQRSGDQQGAEDHYRSATYFAASAQDQDAVTVWATNVGNACARAGRYSEAMKFYEQALDTAVKTGNASALLNAASQLRVCLSHAYRHEEGGDRLRVLAEQQSEERVVLTLLDRALEMYDQGLCAAKVVATAQAIEARLAGRAGVSADYLDRVRSMREKCQTLLDAGPVPRDGPSVLDVWLCELMEHAQSRNEYGFALQAANLVCDVRLALALRGETQWQRMVGGDLLKVGGLDHRVVVDALEMLLQADQVDSALEILQRYKAPSYCVPALLRQQANAASSKEAAAFASAAMELRDRVDGLAAPAPRDVVRPVNDMRRAGEKMREAGEALREVDPLLLARLGGSVRRDELIDALPYQSGVAIVDYVVGATGTVGVVLTRGAEGVAALPFITPTFTAESARELLEICGAANVSQQLGGAQTEALFKIGQILHDQLFCGLARELSKYGVTQLILIPDILTRNLPLHLSLACGKEFAIPGIDTQDADFLCEVMPVEYAPCLQAVAASQHSVRPRQIRRVAAFADPSGDLPGMRACLARFGAQADDQCVFSLASGPEATRDAAMAAVPTADIVLFGTHGKFSSGALDQTGLVMSGAPWTAGDMMRMEDLQKRALLILMACEVGAVGATPDDRSAWGIPGALLSAGASGVLANLWPVECVTAKYLLERFLVHLGHRGFRPAAAWFRAVQNLRRLNRDEALAYCREYLDQQRQVQAPPSVLVGIRTILRWVEDTDAADKPFAHPFFWGATGIFGSGWHLPAGGFVGNPTGLIDSLTQLERAEGLLRSWNTQEALDLARDVAAQSDGRMRAHAYTTMAWARLLSSDLGSRLRARREAIRLLNAAQRIATNEEDTKLLKRVAWMRERVERDYVVENDE